MPRVTNSLFTGTILIVALCQVFAQQASYGNNIAQTDLLFALIFLFCAAGVLTSWLGKPVKRKPEDDSDSTGSGKKPPTDTAL